MKKKSVQGKIKKIENLDLFENYAFERKPKIKMASKQSKRLFARSNKSKRSDIRNLSNSKLNFKSRRVSKKRSNGGTSNSKNGKNRVQRRTRSFFDLK